MEGQELADSVQTVGTFLEDIQVAVRTLDPDATKRVTTQLLAWETKNRKYDAILTAIDADLSKGGNAAISRFLFVLADIIAR